MVSQIMLQKEIEENLYGRQLFCLYLITMICQFFVFLSMIDNYYDYFFIIIWMILFFGSIKTLCLQFQPHYFSILCTSFVGIPLYLTNDLFFWIVRKNFSTSKFISALKIDLMGPFSLVFILISKCWLSFHKNWNSSFLFYELSALHVQFYD